MSGLPDSWSETSLLNLSTTVRGVTYKKDQVQGEPTDGFIPVLRANNLTSNGFDLADLVYAPNQVVSTSQLIKTGDIIIAMSSGSIRVVGKTVQAKINMHYSFGAFCGALRPSTQVHNRYFGYFLQTEEYRSKVSLMAKGSNINNLKWSHFEQIDIPLAPLNEQKRIAEKLDILLAAVDACRARLDKVPMLIKRFRQSVLASATSGALTEDWHERKGSRPWKDTTVGELCNHSFYGPRFGKNEYTENGVPTIRTTDMTRDGLIKITDETPRVKVTSEKLDNFRVKKGDLLITRTGSIGIMAVFNENYDAIPSAYLIRFRFDSSVLSRFMFFCLMAPAGQNALGLSTTTTTQPNINAEAIKLVGIQLPDIKEQTEIIRRVDALFAIADKLEASLATARKRVDQLTPSILAQAFRGELVAQDPTDEPASALLARIADAAVPKRALKKAA